MGPRQSRRTCSSVGIDMVAVITFSLRGPSTRPPGGRRAAGPHRASQCSQPRPRSGVGQTVPVDHQSTDRPLDRGGRQRQDGPVGGGQEPEQRSQGRPALQGRRIDARPALAHHLAVGGQVRVPAEGRPDQIDRRGPPAGDLPVEGHKGRAARPGADPQVPPVEVAVDQRPGHPRAELLHLAPAPPPERRSRPRRLRAPLLRPRSG